MEEPKTVADDQKETKKWVISVGRVAAVSGSLGGVGVGMIFLGGVMATTAFAFLFRRTRRREKSGNENKNRDHADRLNASMTEEVPAGKFMAGSYKKEDTDSSDMQKHVDENFRIGLSSNRKVQENCDGFVAPEGNFFLESTGNHELDGRNQNPLGDGEELVHFNSPAILGDKQFDGCATEKDELPSPILARMVSLPSNHILPHTFFSKDNEIMGKHDDDGSAIFDQGTQKWCRDIFVDPQEDKMDAYIRKVSYELDMNCRESDEITKAMNSSEEIQCQIHASQENRNFGNSVARICNLDKGLFQPVAAILSVSEDRKLFSEGGEHDTSCQIKTMGMEEKHEEGSRYTGEGITRNQCVEAGDDHFGVNESQKLLVVAVREDHGNERFTNLMVKEVETFKQHDSSLMCRIEENINHKDADEFIPAMLISGASLANREMNESVADHDERGDHEMQQQEDELRNSLPDGDDQEHFSVPDELKHEHSPRRKDAENKIENEFKDIQKHVELTLDLREKLQMPKTEKYVKIQALMSLNKVHNVGITEKILLRKGNSGENSFKLSLFGRYILQLVELTQQTTNSNRQRMLVFTSLVLSGSLRIWYFSRPFLKIVLVHFRNYLLIKLHLKFRNYFRNHLRMNLIPKMLGI